MKQIILVAMLDSVHTVRWLKNWESRDEVEITLIPSGPHRRIHPELLSLMQPQGPVCEIKGQSVFGGLFSYVVDKFFGTAFQMKSLREAVTPLESSDYYLHYLETQHSGYLALRLLEIQAAPIVVGSNWGSDLYWFGRLNRHRKKLRKLLEKTDKYLVECDRDYELADDLGFSGQKSIVGPNSFIYETRLNVQKENLIVVKGYQGWAGRAHYSLRALVRARFQLSDFEILVYSANLRTRIYCRFLRVMFGLNVSAYPKHFFNQEQMIGLFARSRIYVGASRTDGISTSALEAMNQGALPIQTSTSCIGDLITHGATGFVPSPTKNGLHESILGALQMLNGNSEFISANQEILMSYASRAIARKRFAFAYDLDY